MNRRTKYIVTLLVIILAFSGLCVVNEIGKRAEEAKRQQEANAVYPFLTEAAQAFDEAAKTVASSDEKGFIAVYDKEDKHLGYILISTPYSDQITGYAGPTPLLIALGPDEKIVSVIFMPNDETPGFIERVEKSGYMDNWKGVNWKEAADLQVDSVSGATRTSESVKKTLNHRLSLVNEQDRPTKTAAPASVKKGFFDDWKAFCPVFMPSDVGVIIIALAGLLLSFTNFKKHNLLRQILLMFSILYLGFYLGMMVSLSALAGIAQNGPAALGAVGMVVLILVALIAPVVAGKNVYCYFICPFGGLQESIFRIFPNKIKIKPDLFKKLRKIRYLLLIITVILLVTRINVNPSDLEPFPAFLFRSAGPASLAIAIVSLLLSTGIKRPWCNFFCTTGALLDSLERPRKKSEQQGRGFDNESENEKKE